MNTLHFSCRRTLPLLIALLFAAGSALAFTPYNGKKFKNAQFKATGGLLAGQRKAVGSVSFKFKGDAQSTKATFKGKVETGGKKSRFKGSIGFRSDGTVEIKGLPGQGNRAIKGTYKFGSDGTTVLFTGKDKVKIEGLGEIEVKIDGTLKLASDGNVEISGKVDAGFIKGKFSMDSSKKAPKR